MNIKEIFNDFVGFLFALLPGAALAIALIYVEPVKKDEDSKENSIEEMAGKNETEGERKGDENDDRKSAAAKDE